MDAVTVSPKYQIVIPRSVRERVRIRPGERLQVISFDDRIELIPIRPMREMKGFLKDFDAGFERDEEEHVPVIGRGGSPYGPVVVPLDDALPTGRKRDDTEDGLPPLVQTGFHLLATLRDASQAVSA